MRLRSLFPGQKIQCAFSTVHVPWPYLRQTPKSDGRWGNIRFEVRPSRPEDQWMFVMDRPHPEDQMHPPYARRILLLSEPPEIKTYDPALLNQFGTVIGGSVPEDFQGFHIRQQAALPWHYGIRRSQGTGQPEAHDSFADMAASPTKTKDISVICSALERTPQQRLRLAFVTFLKDRLGDRIVHYGRGFEPIDDKRDAIAPFRFHLALENTTVPHFWTEKLADTFLGEAYPFFAGPENVSLYFPQGSYSHLQLDDFEAAAARIEAQATEAHYTQALPLIQEAKRRVMWKHNMFALVADLIQSRSDH